MCRSSKQIFPSNRKKKHLVFRKLQNQINTAVHIVEAKITLELQATHQVKCISSFPDFSNEK